ncbi:MAG: MBL fold metallo-hydrolase [Bacteroidales bacterium]
METELTFLGTGTSQGVPVIACPCRVCASVDKRDHRLRASVWIRSKGLSVVIDAGPDFRYQMLRAGVSALDAILVTHAHRDHIAGLDDIRAYNYVQQKPMDIYAEPFVQEALRNDYSYVFKETKYPGIPEIRLHNIDPAHLFSVGVLQFQPIRVMHMNLPVLGFRLNGLAYITDASAISEAEMEKLNGLDVLVINALRKKEHISHFTLAQSLDVIKRVKPKRAYLTHLSHQIGLHADLQRELPQGVYAAYDGLTVVV